MQSSAEADADMELDEHSNEVLALLNQRLYKLPHEKDSISITLQYRNIIPLHYIVFRFITIIS